MSLQRLPTFFRAVDELEQGEVLLVDGAEFGKRIEVDDTLPIFSAKQNDRYIRRLSRLFQGEDLKELIQCPEPAGKDSQSVGPHGEMHLTDREIAEVERKSRRQIVVWLLLAGQPDVKADAWRANLEGAAIGGLHDAGSATRRDDTFFRVSFSAESAPPRSETILPNARASSYHFANPLCRSETASPPASGNWDH